MTPSDPPKPARGETVFLRATSILGSLALAVTLVVLTTGASGEHPSESVRSSLAGEPVRLSLPGGGVEPKGVVLWFHGQGGNVNDRVDGPWLDALRRDGWAIASSNFHAQSWGNPASTQDTARLIRWAERMTGARVKVWVSGSMGGAVSLNALIHGVRPPPCWYGVKPAIALTDLNEVPGGPGYIFKAFDGPVPPERNPVKNVSRLPRETRYRVVSSREDHWVIYDENSGPLIDKLHEFGVEVSELEAVGLHDDPSHWQPRDLVSFANSCLGERSSSASD